MFDLGIGYSSKDRIFFRCGAVYVFVNGKWQRSFCDKCSPCKAAYNFREYKYCLKQYELSQKYKSTWARHAGQYSYWAEHFGIPKYWLLEELG